MCFFFVKIIVSVMKKNISNERKKALLEFCRPLGLKFKNLELLNMAFHHCSYSNENHSEKLYNNERLEFLGDSVLGLATADFLYNDMSRTHAEGDLAKIKAVVVSEKTLAPIGLRFGIDRMLVLGHGEELSGGRKKPAIIADCMEAIIGAYYLDSGYENCEKYVLSFIVPEVKKVQEFGGKDFKTLLQELYQKKYKQAPRYELVDVSGPDHDQKFKVNVHLGELVYGPAEGKSKKEAEQKAAEMAYNCLK